MEITELLKEIGLSKIQAKIYLEILALKKARVMDIYRQTKIARSNIYHNLAKLKKQKLVREVIEGKQKFYCPENPRLLLQSFSEKEKLAKDLVREIGEEENSKVKKPIRIYSRYSPEAHVKVWDMIVEQGYNINPVEFGLYNNWQSHVKKSMHRRQVIEYMRKRHEKNIFFKSLQSRRDCINIKRDKSIPILPKEIKDIKDKLNVLPDDLQFFVDLISIRSLIFIFSTIEEDYLVIIISNSFSSFYRKIFNYFWKRSKKPEEIKEIKNLMVTGGGIEPPT